MIQIPNLPFASSITGGEAHAAVVSRNKSVFNVGITMASLDTVLVQNDEGLYSLLIPYSDSMGNGAIYRSIEPGFTFKDVFAFFHDHKFYVITQNEQNT